MLKTSLLILLIALSTIRAISQQPDPFLSDKMALQDSKRFIQKSSFTENQNYSFYDLTYQRMEWEIDPNVLYIKGNVTSYFKSEVENLTKIEFNLDLLMTIDSIIQNNKNVDYSRNKNKVIIELNTTLTEQQIDSVTIFYQGEPSNVGFGAFSKTIHQNIPNIWTLSEPYGAMKWWPCKQSLVDKIDSIDIIVTSPDSYRTASIGVLVSETTLNNFRKMHWKHRFPIATYLVAISVTNYVNYSDSLVLEDGRKIEILNYVYPEYLEIAKSKTPQTIEIMALFNKLFGEYPFSKEKYGHAQFGWGGGMEHQTMSFMNNFEFGLISHELAHQWFGDYITLGSWQDIWLNEGFASYLTGLSYEHLENGVWWPRWRKLSVEKIVREPGGSVFVEDTTSISQIFDSRLSYTKGAYILHMLRWILGDNDFYTGMQNYFKDPKIANNFARTHQFVEHMENAADTSLTEFINDWYYGEGFPIYSIQFAPTESNSLKITLSQTSSHNSVDFFEMPVPIRIYNFGKTDSMYFRLDHSFNNQEFVVNPEFNVSEIKIDPEYWMVSKTAEIVKIPLIESTDEIVIYPNPFSDKLSVFAPSGLDIISIKLYSANGNLSKEFIEKETELNLSDISKGVYILQVETTNGLFEQKIIKQ